MPEERIHHQTHGQRGGQSVCALAFYRSDIKLQELIPYHARFDEMIEGSQGLTRTFVKAFQGAINLLERFTPALNAGWVGVARI